MRNHTAAEKAAQQTGDYVRRQWPNLSMEIIQEYVQAAIDAETARHEPLVKALKGMLDKDIYRGISSGLLHCDICAAKNEHPTADAASINHQEECPAGIAQAALKQVEEPKGGNANAELEN